MVVLLHQCAAAIYLVAGLAAGLALVLPARRLGRAAVWVLVAAVACHGVAFALLHMGEPPPLTDLPAAVSFMAWIGTLFFLVLLRRVRLSGLVVLVAPMAFLGAFFAAVRLPLSSEPTFEGSGSWPHAHVLLSSAGISLLGLACLAGLFFLVEHGRLKAKQPLRRVLPLPSLEALDRVNASALAVGFPLLSLGVLTGMMWAQAVTGRYWTATPHETWTAIAWVVYAVLSAARFGSHQGRRRAALSAVGGFAFLMFAVIGVEILA